MSDQVHSESEFYYLDELEFKKNSDLTETNYTQVGERENKGNSQGEIETFLKEQKVKSQERKQSGTKKHFNTICHQTVVKIKIILDQKMHCFN